MIYKTHSFKLWETAVSIFVPPVVNTPFSEMTSGGSVLPNEYLKIKKFQGKIKKEKTFF